MKRKMWVRRTRDGSNFYLGTEGTKPGRFPLFSYCHYPHSNVSLKSDKSMEVDSIYEVKEIIFKVTKRINGFTTGISKSTHGMSHFRISGCYVFLGKKLSPKQIRSLSQSLPNEYGIIRHQGNIPSTDRYYTQLYPQAEGIRREEGENPFLQARHVFNRYGRREPSREGDQS